MSERRPDHGEDGAAILVQVIPTSYRRQAVFFVGLGLLMVAVTVVLAVVWGRDPTSLLIPVAAIGYGLYCARRARRQVSTTAMRIDRSGLRTGDGMYEHTWAGVLMVWVGSSSGLCLPVVAQPVLHVYTRAGVEFAGRAGTRPQPLYTMPAAGLWRVPVLCERLRRLTDAEVVDGTTVSRRAAAASLARGAARR